MNDYEPEFQPEYNGDNPNRKWIRDKMEERGIHLNYTDVILHMSPAHIKWVFGKIMDAEFPGWR